MPDRSYAPDRRNPPQARDGEIAVREEYDAAVASGTRAALELFVARHPGHPLAADAQRRLAAPGPR